MFIQVSDDLWVDGSDVKRVEIHGRDVDLHGERQFMVSRIFDTPEEARAFAVEIVKQLNGGLHGPEGGLNEEEALRRLEGLQLQWAELHGKVRSGRMMDEVRGILGIKNG